MLFLTYFWTTVGLQNIFQWHLFAILDGWLIHSCMFCLYTYIYTHNMFLCNLKADKVSTLWFGLWFNTEGFLCHSTSRSQPRPRSLLMPCESFPSTCPATAKINLRPALTAFTSISQGEWTHCSVIIVCHRWNSQAAGGQVVTSGLPWHYALSVSPSLCHAPLFANTSNSGPYVTARCILRFILKSFHQPISTVLYYENRILHLLIKQLCCNLRLPLAF